MLSATTPASQHSTYEQTQGLGHSMVEPPTSPPSTWFAGEAIKGIPRDQVVIATKWGWS